MREIHILNPAAGMRKAKLHIPEGIEVYESIEQHDLEEHIKIICEQYKNEKIHITVYGGDGSANEAINGIMRAETNAVENVILSIVPKGTGNDFVRNFPKGDKIGEIRTVDVIKVNDRYAMNLINIGFDCDVVAAADKFKKFFLTRGSLGYILGVAKTLFHKRSISLDVSYTTQDGTMHKINGEYLLADIANGKYCGGGFKAAPAARLDDGLIDVMVINDMKIPTFLKLVGAYRKGDHIDDATALAGEKYKNLLTYHQCKSVTVKNISRLCLDGEMYYTDYAEISVVPSCVKVMIPSLDLTKKIK